MKNLDLFVLACVIITIVLAIVILIKVDKVDNNKQHYTNDTSYCVIKLDDNNPVLPSPSAKCTYSFPSKRINNSLVSIPNEPNEAIITIDDFFNTEETTGYVLSTGAPDGYDIGKWYRDEQSTILNITASWAVLGYYALVSCSGSNCGP